MPINIPNKLPARKILEKEGVKVIEEKRAARQDIRPLEIAVMNLMPAKEVAETQWARLLGNTPLQINLTLFTSSRETCHTSSEHMQSFYKSFNDIKGLKFDGLIITGAPVEQLPFNKVSYWKELCLVMEWAKSHVHSSFYVCWAAQAALYHFYGITKFELPEKLSGVYPYRTVSEKPVFVRGFNDEYIMPVSRNTTVRTADIAACHDLEILCQSDLAGVGYVRDKSASRFYMFNHLEYDAFTLRDEYERDMKKGLNPSIPFNYFPDNDPTQTPKNRWRSHAFLMISNWLDHIYQTVPFDAAKIGE